MENLKIETWLPVFSGFYGTIWEANEDCEIEHINSERARLGLEAVSFDDMNFDYHAYNLRCAEAIVNTVENHLSDFVSGIAFQELRSPREYNFANDSINVVIELSEANVKTIGDFLTTNKEAFAQYLKDRYTSCSGFISSYPNTIDEFMQGDPLQDRHKLGAILDFIAEFEDGNETELNLYYQCTDLYIECNNYDELVPN